MVRPAVNLFHRTALSSRCVGVPCQPFGLPRRVALVRPGGRPQCRAEERGNQWIPFGESGQSALRALRREALALMLEGEHEASRAVSRFPLSPLSCRGGAGVVRGYPVSSGAQSDPRPPACGGGFARMACGRVWRSGGPWGGVSRALRRGGPHGGPHAPAWRGRWRTSATGRRDCQRAEPRSSRLRPRRGPGRRVRTARIRRLPSL